MPDIAVENAITNFLFLGKRNTIVGVPVADMASLQRQIPYFTKLNLVSKTVLKWLTSGALILL